jgi:hypothetical protein
MAKQARDYKREYKLYHGRPEQIKRRAQRNKARRMLAKAGLVSKGDGKDVHHVDNDTSNFARNNLRVLAKEKNRSMK